MKNTTRLSRAIFFITLLISLLAFVSAPALTGESVNAAPVRQAPDVDLSVTMGVDDNTPDKDQDITFTLTVSNSVGSAPASNVTVNAPLPPGLDYVSDDGGGAYAGGIWTIGALTNGSNATLHITATNTTVAPKTVTVVASNTPETEFSAPDNTAFVVVTPNKADLSLTNTIDNPNPVIGTPVVFTITVTNNGPDDATNVSVKDALPVGLSYSSDTSGGTYVGGIWTIGSLAKGTNATLQITTTVLVAGSKINWAEVWTSDQFDPDSTPGNGSIAEDDDNTPSADLKVTMGMSPSIPLMGGDVAFTITVKNNGPDIATGVTVLDKLPAGLVYVKDDGGGTYNNASGIWVLGSLANGASQTLKITANLPLSASGTYTNTAQVDTSEQYDSNLTDNTASKDVTAYIADLEITEHLAVVTPDTKYVTFTIKVKNNGTNDATGITVKDVLPDGLVYVSDDLGTYNSGSGIWAIGFLANGAETTLNLTARFTALGAKTNVAEVWTSDVYDNDSTPGDGAGDDYLASPLAQTTTTADLSLTKTADMLTGGAVTFTVRVTNNDLINDATNVEVRDILPAVFTSPVFSPSVGSYNSGTGIWTIGTLAKNTTETLLITANYVSGFTPINTAEVWKSDQLDLDSTPGSESSVKNEDDDDGAPYADLSLTKTVNNLTPKIGENVVFTITVNNSGPLDATGVEVKDLLNTSNFGFVSSVQTGGGAGYVPSTGIWGVGSLASGASATLTITATVKQTGELVNSAQVWKSDQFDPDSAPGSESSKSGEDDDKTIKLTTSSGMAVVISEVAWAGTTAGNEWIELYNPGTIVISLDAWALEGAGSGSNEIILSGTIDPGGFFILADSSSTFSSSAEPVTVNQTSSSLSLDNGGEPLKLVDKSGNTIDTANKDGIAWPAGDDGDNKPTMERIVTEVDGVNAWYTNQGIERYGFDSNGNKIFGTPGKKNSTPPVATATPTATSTPTPVTQTPTRTPSPTRPSPPRAPRHPRRPFRLRGV